jgi:hypothetical protein
VLLAVALPYQDVSGLDVAVDESAPVCFVQRICHLCEERDATDGRDAMPIGKQRAQIASVDVAHGEVEEPTLFSGLEDLDDVRVIDRRRDATLTFEAGAEDRIARHGLARLA